MAELTAAREAALYVLSRTRRFDAWSAQTLQKAAEKFSLSERDIALSNRLCLSVLQNAALCDYYIGCYSSVPVRKLEPAVLDILRLGICQLLFMDRIPVSAAVSQAVESTKRLNSRASGLVNAVLRRIGENRDSLPAIPGEGTALSLATRFSHPLWLAERMIAYRGYEFASAFFEANNREAPLTLSVNLTKTDAPTLADKLNAAGFECRVHETSPVSVELARGGDVTRLPGFSEGEFFVQDAAAAMAALASGAKSGMRVLDACAAPGGKSFLCASLMRGEGEILSCDLHEKKLARIDESAQRLGFSCIRTIPMDAAEPYANLKESFDLVLADVPCSGLGVIRKKPEIRYKPEEELGKLPEVQLRILRGASQCVKGGGTLLYSTCTVLPEENEEVVSAFLHEQDGYTMEDMRTFWPHIDGTDGFFFCRMKKHE